MSYSSYKTFTEEEEDDGPKYTPYQSLVFLIDSSSQMHVKDNGQSLFESCLQATIATIQTKINQRSKDQVAVLFYGTKHSKSLKNAMSSHKSIYIAMDMSYLDLDDTLKLEKYKSNSRLLMIDMEYFDKEVGSSDDVQLGNLFWATSQLLTGKTQSQRSKKVFMMTSNSDPSPNDQDDGVLAKTRYKDMLENDISFFLLPLKNSFNTELFYQKYLGEEIMDDDVRIYDRNELIKAISTFESRARVVLKVPFILGDGLVCGINGCYKIIESKKPSPCYLEEKTNQEVETLTTYCSAETGGTLKKEEISYSYEYGGVKAVFTKEEIQKMKNFGEPRLVLLGFHPVSWLKFKYNVKHSIFLFPNEEEYYGSSCLLANLADVMCEKNVIAIAALVSSPTSTPRYLALLPSVPAQENQVDTVDIGFNGIFLPFKDDLRIVDSSVAPLGKQAAEEVTSSIKCIIESLTIPKFTCESVSNPELSLFYAGLVSMARELDEMEQVQDEIRPNFEWIDQEAGQYIRICNKVNSPLINNRIFSLLV